VNGADALGWQAKTWAPAELDAAEARGCSFGVRFNVPALRRPRSTATPKARRPTRRRSSPTWRVG